MPIRAQSMAILITLLLVSMLACSERMEGEGVRPESMTPDTAFDARHNEPSAERRGQTHNPA
jgi:hypothetical protein